MSRTSKDINEYIQAVNVNNLSGRVIRMPAALKNKREILLIAGQHTSIERIMGLVEYLNRYGGVTSPDLPGFGGMEPFYKIGKKPTLDNMADYVATFIKLRYKKNEHITIIGVSFGFSVVTRMLQQYPDIAKRVDLLISISGIASKENFKWKRHNVVPMHAGSWILSQRISAWLATNVALRGPFIRFLYKIAEKKHPKLKDVREEEREERLKFEVILWKINDFRTWMATCVTMFELDLGDKHVALPVHHVAVGDDHYFDHLSVEQHMRRVYSDFEIIETQLTAHAPTIIATPKDVEPFMPPRIRSLLRQKVK